MTALQKIIAHGARPWKWSDLDQVKPDADWRRTWREIDGWEASSTPPFLDELHDLNAFGNYGIFPTWAFAGSAELEQERAAHLRCRLEALRDAPAWIEGVCMKIDLFERIAPRDAEGKTSLDALLQTRDRARARVKLDQGRSISINEVALLSGVSLKRVQNAVYAKTDEAPIVDKNGLVSPEASEGWLAARDYMPSIWRQVGELYPLQEGWGEDVEFAAVEQAESVEDFIFLPVANDGTMFTPGLRRKSDNRFVIGPKGNERPFDSFEEALAELHKMDTPRWRRPNPQSGLAGIVSGQGWKRVRKSELAGV
jgi:hypothetical protein